MRPSDSSSVLRANDYADIARRSYDPDGQRGIERFISAGSVPAFMTHEMLPQIELYFAVCPNTRVVEIVRHPVDVIMSWCIRGWGERHGVDPLAFTPTFTHRGKPVPWMAAAWPDEYLEMAPWDRVICCIASYTNLRNEKLASLGQSERGRVHVISYEHLTEDPIATISGVGEFLGRQVPANMAALVAREGVTAATGIANRRRKFAELAAKTAASSMDRLRAISAQYEAQWSLEPVAA